MTGKFTSISEAIAKGKGEVAIRGWVYRERGSNELKFLVLRDSSDIIQCVLKKEKFKKLLENGGGSYLLNIIMSLPNDTIDTKIVIDPLIGFPYIIATKIYRKIKTKDKKTRSRIIPTNEVISS